MKNVWCRHGNGQAAEVNRSESHDADIDVSDCVVYNKGKKTNQ